ncbi:MAG: beta-L-arabinofuranosidase domain-containing protein, partial [Anaerolineae bacterium]
MDDPTPIVVDTTHSPHARLKPAPLTAVALDDAFWAPRRHLLRTVTLPTQFRLIEETGRLDNFRRVSGRVDPGAVPFKGYFFNDSDVYKWIEAAAWATAAAPDPALTAMMDAAIAEIEAAQRPDGYINTYYAVERADQRWTNLKDMHELYCAGHLFQAAVAHHRTTGSDRLLTIARRMADHIGAVFGPEPKRAGTCGHPEVEMGLVELARATGDEKYLAQAQYFLDVRGRGVIGGSPYHQDHKPFRELDRMVGHAVRGLYLNAGAADLYAESGEEAVRAALGAERFDAAAAV